MCIVRDCKDMRTVRLLFLKATDDDHWMNRLVSKLDPPFCHVELDFDMTDLEHIAKGIPFSVTQGSALCKPVLSASHANTRTLDSLDVSFLVSPETRTQPPDTTKNPHGQNTSLASSIYSGETVFLRPRTFANPNYTVLTLLVTDRQFDAMLKFCVAEAKNQRPFNQMAMVASFLPCRTMGAIRDISKGTFCSEHVTRALQAGSVSEVRTEAPHMMRPSTLYRIFSQSRHKCFGTVPYKMGLIDKVDTPISLPKDGLLNVSL